MRLSVAVMVSEFSLRPETFPFSQTIGQLECGHPVDIYTVRGCPAQREKMHPQVMTYRLLGCAHSAPGFSNKRIARMFRVSGPLLTDCWKDPSLSLRLISGIVRPNRTVPARPINAATVRRAEIHQLLPGAVKHKESAQVVTAPITAA